MATSTKKKLAYQAQYNAQPAQKEAGVERRRIRRQEIREGKVAIGDGKDLAHRVAMDNGGRTTEANVKVQSEKENRGWRRGAGYKVPNVK